MYKQVPGGVRTDRQGGRRKGCKQTNTKQKWHLRASLVVQWLRICLPRKGTWVNPWYRKIPHAVWQLSLYTTTTEALTP